MLKPQKQIQVDFIISCLEKGEQRGGILVKAGKKWGISKSAFDRLLKIAKDQHFIKHGAIKKKLEEVDTEAAIEARKKAIMTSDERKEYLTKIITGEIKVTRQIIIGGKLKQCPEYPSHRDRISAISELNKMCGDHAPAKMAMTDTKGNDVKPGFDLSKYTDDELRTIAELQRKGRAGEA